MASEIVVNEGKNTT